MSKINWQLCTKKGKTTAGKKPCCLCLVVVLFLFFRKGRLRN